MPRKTLFGMDHVKSVKRGRATYLYFNTGEKIDGKAVYTALGRAGTIEVGSRYSAALAARSRRTGSPTSLLLKQLVQRFEASPEYRKKSAGTQRAYSVYLKRLAVEFDTAPAGNLDPSDIYELLDEMGDTPAAIEMLLLAGNQMYRWALRRKYVHRNPFEGIDREEWEAREYEPWPDDVIEEALADPRLRVPVALLYFTAQRIGDCLKMEWEHIAGKEIFVKQQKTKKEMWVRLHSRLLDILADAPRHGKLIVSRPDGKAPHHQTVRDWIKDFGTKRGLALVPHGLRKNAVNALLEADCSVGETASISGQSLRMVEHYAKKRNSRKMGGRAIGKWEQAVNRETSGKTPQERAE